ncbi:MAG TPA: ankyrin repeat domain-containing protein [Chitinophagaceae bacterium]|jgi:ankyrin repeat protein|nr:ankyrin repeat domain-containing protein [Chitinophagaceae bacterium]
MLQPIELKKDFPVELSDGVLSSTGKVWEILSASKEGNLQRVKELVTEYPALAYAQYNYTPPIHFAVREGHKELVSYLLQLGAHAPSYRIYPFLDTLQTIAADRGYMDIVSQLDLYASNPDLHVYSGDNGAIHYNRTETEAAFEEAVGRGDISKVAALLKDHPKLTEDETFFWGEGILMRPAKENKREMVELLMKHGATVPSLLKWTQFYYFENYEIAAFLVDNGMNPNVQSWHHVTILHDMAQKGDIAKAKLLIEHGADINRIDEEYQSTPLGMAARWGHEEMVKYLIGQGADPNTSGASWATPLAWATKKEHQVIEKLLHKAGAQ